MSAVAHSNRTYWPKRYRQGGDSGAGSRGASADRKAELVNRLVADNGITSVVDWGCGDGAQLSRFEIDCYTGVEIAPAALCKAVERRPDSAFVLWAPGRFITITAECALSLDVLFHFPDDQQYSEYVERLFGSAMWYVAIHSTNHDEQARRHVRHRKVTDDIAERFPGWECVQHEPGGWPGARWLVYARRLPVVSFDDVAALHE